MTVDSDFKRRLLDVLRLDGRSRNWARLQALGYTREEFERKVQPLIAAGIVINTGVGYARVNPLGGDLSDEAAVVLSRIPGDGSTISGQKLRGLVNLDNDTYRRAIEELKARALILAAPGYSGLYSRAEPEAPAVQRPRVVVDDGLIARESELYEPFREWLVSSWAGQEGVDFADARVTGTGQDWPLRSGRWSRPDVTTVRVTTYDFLPERVVEVATYEIKRNRDAEKRECVYEAAAHGRWAHRASLVLEMPAGDGAPPDLPDLLMQEARRFGLGLYVIRRRGHAWDVEEVLEPDLQHPQPEHVNEFLSLYLQRGERLAHEFRRAIGRLI
jgi:hypothetical protein